MFIHRSLIISFKLLVSLRSRVLHFFKRFSHFKDRKHGTSWCPLSVLLPQLPEVLSHKGRVPSDHGIQNNSHHYTSSVGRSWLWPRKTSGVSIRLGTATVSVQRLPINSLLRLMSVISTCTSASKSRFSGFRSLWTTPFSWQCCTAGGSCWNTHQASFSVMRPWFTRYSNLSPPLT